LHKDFTHYSPIHLAANVERFIALSTEMTNCAASTHSSYEVIWHCLN